MNFFGNFVSTQRLPQDLFWFFSTKEDRITETKGTSIKYVSREEEREGLGKGVTSFW